MAGRQLVACSISSKHHADHYPTRTGVIYFKLQLVASRLTDSTLKTKVAMCAVREYFVQAASVRYLGCILRVAHGQ